MHRRLSSGACVHPSFDFYVRTQTEALQLEFSCFQRNNKLHLFDALTKKIDDIKLNKFDELIPDEAAHENR